MAKSFIPWIEAVIRTRVRAPINNELLFTIYNQDRLTNLSGLSTKQLRETKSKQIPVTDYKIGLTMGVSESLTWCHRIRKLTSAKHHNSLLKTAHGDVYTKDRKMRFGLADNDRCDRCGNPDSRVHAIAKCPKALEIWNTFRRLDNKTALTEHTDNLLAEVFGVTDPIGGELRVHAEVMQALTNTMGGTMHELPANIIAKIILTKLYTLEKGNTKEKIKALLDKLGGDD